ncbi:MAG: hypothetical protein AB1650_07820 [Candidatus Omnitrophota bacterium]
MKIFEWLTGLNAETASLKSPFRKFIKTEIAILYLSILKLMHRVIVYFLKIIASILLIHLGVIFLLVALAIHSDYIEAASLIVGILFVIIPLIAVIILLTPSSWMKIFKIDKFLEDIRNGSGE